MSATTNQDGHRIRLVLNDGERDNALDMAEEIVSRASSQLLDLHFEEPSLEDVLIEVVGESDQS